MLKASITKPIETIADRSEKTYTVKNYMTNMSMLTYRQRTNFLKFAIIFLTAVAIGLMVYFSWKRNERWLQAESVCIPGIVEKIQGNQVLCTTGEKQWVVTYGK